MTFGDEQCQPWRIVQTWLELRHDLAAVALLQVWWPPRKNILQRLLRISGISGKPV